VQVEQAVALTRLELRFQTDHWGSVEWAHGIEEHDTTARWRWGGARQCIGPSARLAAATLFVQLSTAQSSTKAKNIQL
jgi:hypothetical protein